LVARGIEQRRRNILLGKIVKVGQQLLPVCPVRHRFDNVGDAHTRPFDARPPAANRGVEGYSAEKIVQLL
jgi:hypothetical protein